MALTPGQLNLEEIERIIIVNSYQPTPGISFPVLKKKPENVNSIKQTNFLSRIGTSSYLVIYLEMRT